MKVKKLASFLICLLLLLCACSDSESFDAEKLNEYPESPAINRSDVRYCLYSDDRDDGVVVLSLSTMNQGYIGACLKQDMNEKIKLGIVKDDKQYNYDILSTEMVAYPLQMGNGTYLIKILKQYEGNNYAVIYSEEISVNMDDELSTYLYPNQIVNYNKESSVINISFEEVKDDKNDLQRIYHLFTYVLDNLDYDKEKASAVKTVYTLPDLEDALAKGKGICFDYASLLASLCRIQGIPARVIVGYTDIEYHAWCEIYLENEGWINPKLIFDSKDWSLVDPTFADSGKDYEGNYDEVYHY